MVSPTLEQGIQAVQAGRREEGARLIRIALKETSLPPNLRAVGLMWLAETSDDVSFKIDCYQKASQADPNNQDVSQRLSYWMTQQLPSGNTPSQPMSPVNPQQSPQQGQQFPQQGQPPYQQGQQLPQQGQPPYQQGQQLPQQGQPPYQQGQQLPQQGQPPYQQGQQLPQQGQPPYQQGQQLPQQGQPPYQQGQQLPQQGQPYPVGNTPSQPMPAVNPNQQPLVLQQAQRSVGVIGGPNGAGTGFFVTRDGLVVTTRYVVGGEVIVEIQLLDGRMLIGEVVRAFPEYDLALIKTNIQLMHLLSVSRNPNLADNTPLTAVTHTGKGLKTTKRATRHKSAPHWIPTIINHLLDAGGNPIFDHESALVGMLTKNAARNSGYVYGLHISKILQCVQQYQHELQRAVGQSAYCNACGAMSQAPALGGFFCEHCGNTLPAATDITRYPQPNLGQLYQEDAPQPCPECHSRVGFYNGACMRCGHVLS